jgi:L-iditol 2-dehydrogenase
MKAVRKLRAGFGVVVDKVEPPMVSGSSVVVKMKAAGICGSDLHIYDWSPGYEWLQKKLPITLGHEFSGIVVEVGERIAALSVGDRVFVKPVIGCGSCPVCLKDEPENCDHRTSIGFSANGGFSDFTLVPEANCRLIPSGVSFEAAALTEPLCIAARAVRIAELDKGDDVIVMGPGAIGLMIAYVALRAGAARVVLVGHNDQKRLKLATMIGEFLTVDLAEEQLDHALMKFGFQKADRVFEATGVPSTIDVGLSHLRREGILVAAGIHPAHATIDITRLVREKHQLRGTVNHSSIDWQSAEQLILECGDNLQPIITHRLNLDEATKAFALAHGREATKVMLIEDA